MKRLRVILGACTLVVVLALPAGVSAASAGVGAPAGDAQASAAGVHALVVGIGEQHPAMFGDPRFKALDVRYARLSIGWNALESRSESRAIATWMRDARADACTR